MNLNDPDLTSILIRVLIERDQARFIRVNEIGNPGTRCLSSSSLPVLSLLVAIKMNGPDMCLPYLECDVGA